MSNLIPDVAIAHDEALRIQNAYTEGELSAQSKAGRQDGELIQRLFRSLAAKHIEANRNVFQIQLRDAIARGDVEHVQRYACHVWLCMLELERRRQAQVTNSVQN
jgi:hypothetical protein